MMTTWRRYLLRLLLAVLFLLLVVLFSDVEAEVDSRREHRLILDLSDEIEEELGEGEVLSEEEDLEIFQQVPRLREEPVPAVPRWSGQAEAEACDLENDPGVPSDPQNDFGTNDIPEDEVPGHQEEGPEEGFEDMYGGPEYEGLPHCPPDAAEEENRPRPAVVVSTLNGRVTSLDAYTGAVLWSHQTGGKHNDMLSSSMSKLEVTSRGEWVRLIPSLDGGIYRFDGDGVEALPVTADTLLHSSFKFNPDTVFTGGKSTEVWGLAANTGQILYICNADGCLRQQTASKPSKVLVVRRVTQTVRAIDPQSGDERWNFSVGQHDVNLAGGGCEWRDHEEDYNDLPTLNFVVPDGIIRGMDAEGHLLWQQKLGSPVVHAWRVLDGELEPVDLFSTSSVPALSPESGEQYEEGGTKNEEESQQPALYVGVHQKQLYIQQSRGMKKRVVSAASVYSNDGSGQGSSTDVSFPRVQWRPYLATALSRTPVVHYTERKHPLLLNYERDDDSTAVAITHSVEYPFDNGYYLYGEDELHLNLSRPLEAPDDTLTMDEESLMNDMTSHILHICFQIGPDTWLKIAFALTCYVMLHFLMLRYMMVHMRRHVTQQSITLVTRMLNLILQNNPQILALMHRMGVQMPQLPAPPPAPEEENSPQNKENKAAPDSSSSDNKPEPSLPQFSSRYRTDFEPIQCLGRGGFGVVFQVRNKLDENEYAVKRITLPTKESSAERVKREVRALAKLNHTNIVRYYNSWLECPPPGWQDESVALLKSGSMVSMTPYSHGGEETHCEETQDNGMEETASVLKPEETASDSLSALAPSFGSFPNIEVQEGENGSGSGYEEDDEGDEDSDNDTEKSLSWRHNEDSYEVVFDHSLHRTKDGCNEKQNSHLKEDSFEVTFEDSEGSDESEESEKDDDRTKNKILTKVKSIPNAHKNSSGDDSFSELIVFESSECDKKNSFSLSNQNNNNSNDKSSQSRHSPSKTQDGSSNGSRQKKRHRVKSHPAVSDTKETGERPRTLSLQASMEKLGSKAVEHLPNLRSRQFLYIQMELCQKRSLKDWLIQNQKRDHKMVCNMFNDIVKAVEYVHDNSLMHRDLKPSNIFFSLDGEIKIGDFGLVTTITEDENEVRTPADVQITGLVSASNRTHRVGTQLYMSPEQVLGKVYDYKVDIYSLGLIFFEMLVPFATVMERLTVMTQLRDGKFPNGFVEDYPDETDLLKLMLSTNPALRPTTRGIRARQPLRLLQGQAVDEIHPDDHFRLTRQRPNLNSQSSSSYSFASSTSSSK